MRIKCCCETKELVQQIVPKLTQFALRLCLRDLRILRYLLTGHNHLNRHLTLMQRTTDSLCPLCKEDDETSLHFLGKCCGTISRRNQYFGAPLLEPKDLRQVQWINLLRFAKTSRDFNNLIG